MSLQSTRQLPRVSVVLPVCNGAPYIERAIRSILAQTWQDWELLAVDDGSTDESFSLCQALATEDTRIRVFRNATNQGLARTMNGLVALARGRYIAVQEQDDVSHPERLAQEVEVLESRPDVGLVSGIAAWIDDDEQMLRALSRDTLSRRPVSGKSRRSGAFLVYRPMQNSQCRLHVSAQHSRYTSWAI